MKKVYYNRLCIRIPHCDVDPDIKVKDIPKIAFEDCEQFNFKEAHLYGIRMDDCCDCFLLYFKHPNFPETVEGCACVEVSLKEAKEQFPFMFKEAFDITDRYIDI